jgi:hypothetical protein
MADLLKGRVLRPFIQRAGVLHRFPESVASTESGKTSGLQGGPMGNGVRLRIFAWKEKHQ